MQLILKTCSVRSWRPSDAESLVRYADNRNIWINLRDAFPHPYTRRDARDYLRGVRQRAVETTFAIAVDDRAVGGIGFVMHGDVERVSAEIGYWLGEPFWGRGIATRALAEFLQVVTERPLRAHVAMHNIGSMRVLEKCGFVRENEESVELTEEGIPEIILILRSSASNDDNR